MSSLGAMRSRRLVRLLWIVPLALVLLYATTAVSFASIAHRTAPKTVLRLYPWHGPSLASAAAQNTVEIGNAQARDRAREFARASLRNSPLSSPAVRTLALLAEANGDSARALQLMSFARDLTRRDLVTSLWFIEEGVRRDDVPMTLQQYDIALRTSRQANGLLLPNLVGAATHEWMVPYLVQMLEGDPVWGSEFADELIDSDIPAEAKARLTERLRDTRWFGAPFRRELIGSLVTNGDFAVAARIARQPAGFDKRLAKAFGMATADGPFDWKLAATHEITTTFEGEQDRYLRVEMSPEYAGPAAKILSLLPEGRYRLSSGLAAPLPPETAAHWTVRCAAAGGRELARLDLGGSKTTSFVVPAGCEAQQIELTVRSSSTSADSIGFSVSGLSVRPE